MKRSFFALFAAFIALTALVAADAEARRLGGGKSFGMSRSITPTQPARAPKAFPAPPSQPATAPTQTAQPRKPGWLGPIAGLAAGLGLAALASHFGFGEELASVLLIALVILAALFLLRMLTRPRQPQGSLQYAGAGGHVDHMRFEAFEKVGTADTAPASLAANIPADFDREGFLRQAKLNFIRLQAANDRGDMDDLKNFTTPEVFAELELQFEERGRSLQQTDVIQLDAELLELVTEGNQYIASVRFSGLLREERDAAPMHFAEIWHLTKPVDGSVGWRVAGIQQLN